MEREPVIAPEGRPRLVILSGGQTGVDRGALDAALSLGVECGGWCPAGRKAEDGPIHDRYPLIVLPGAGYLDRTRKNVEDSDMTLVIAFGAPTGGTARTVDFCRRLGKPCLVLDGATLTTAAAATTALQFLRASGCQRLNVAGPRASGEPRGYDYAYAVVRGLIAQLR